MKTGSRTTAKNLKANIERAAKAACATWHSDAGMRARAFCSLLSNDIEFEEAALAALLNEVAGIAASNQANESVQ